MEVPLHLIIPWKSQNRKPTKLEQICSFPTLSNLEIGLFMRVSDCAHAHTLHCMHVTISQYLDIVSWIFTLISHPLEWEFSNRVFPIITNRSASKVLLGPFLSSGRIPEPPTNHRCHGLIRRMTTQLIETQYPCRLIKPHRHLLRLQQETKGTV